MDFTVSKAARLRSERSETERLLAQVEEWRLRYLNESELHVKETTRLRLIANDAERSLRLDRDEAMAVLVNRNLTLAESVLMLEREAAELRQALDASERENRLLREEVNL